MTIPFTYYLYHKPTGKKYYGVRYKKNCRPSDIGNIYFTSSVLVHDLIREYGKDSFIYEVRKIFTNKEDAIKWENGVLQRLKVIYREDWINQNHGGGSFGMLGKKHSDETRKKMSERQSGKNNPMFGKTHSEEVKKLISDAGKNRVYTVEQRRNYSIAAKKRGVAESTRLASQSEKANQKRKETLLGHEVSEETREKIRKANSGKFWFNNGIHQTRASEPPGPDYIRGRLK